MLKALLSGSVNVVESLFTGKKKVQRSGGQVKPYYGREEWLSEPPDGVFDPDTDNEKLLPRVRSPPRKLIEDCYELCSELCLCRTSGYVSFTWKVLVKGVLHID